MFVRVKTTPNSPRKAVQLVESVRDGRRVRQNIVRHIGIAMDEAELVQLKDLAEVVKAKLQARTQPELFPPEDVAEQVIAARSSPRDDTPLKVNLKQFRETRRIVTGIHAVYGAVYESLGLDRLLPAYRYRASHKALFHCVMARLANPGSKRANVRQLEADFGVYESLDQVYRMMDRLDEGRITRLTTLAARQAQALLGGPVRVLFFDCTTLYFESFSEDGLKQPGYSKDAKFKECQVLLALAVTETGLPVHYQVLPGATFEGHSLIPVVNALQKDYGVSEAVIVADRGMLSEANLKTLEEAGLHYIVGAKLKTLPQPLQAQVLDETRYQSLGEDGARVLSLPHKDRRLVVSYAPVRAEKDRRDRDKAIGKLRKKLAKSQNPKDLLNNYGYKKYLHVEGKTTLTVNPDKVAEAQRWDGLHGVITNLPDATGHATVLSQYRGLWQVEDTFRVSKHDLKVRPIYHWTPARIRAHLAIAFMTLLCVRHLQYRMALQARAVSPEVIRNALVHVQHSVLAHQQTTRQYVIPSAISETGRQLYKVMGLTHSTTPYELK